MTAAGAARAPRRGACRMPHGRTVAFRKQLAAPQRSAPRSVPVPAAVCAVVWRDLRSFGIPHGRRRSALRVSSGTAPAGTCRSPESLPRGQLGCSPSHSLPRLGPGPVRVACGWLFVCLFCRLIGCLWGGCSVARYVRSRLVCWCAPACVRGLRSARARGCCHARVRSCAVGPCQILGASRTLP